MSEPKSVTEAIDRERAKLLVPANAAEKLLGDMRDGAKTVFDNSRIGEILDERGAREEILDDLWLAIGEALAKHIRTS